MRRAIDLVLLPPKDIQERCIEYNKLIDPKYIRLNAIDQLPHISLLMGGIDDNNLPQVKSKLASIINEFAPLALEVFAVNSGKASDLSIKITDELYALHQIIVEKISPILHYDNLIESVYDHENALLMTLDWINNFIENSAFEKFYPHITIGDALLTNDNVELPLNFIVDTLAICHLGNLCTCREILFEIKLT